MMASEYPTHLSDYGFSAKVVLPTGTCANRVYAVGEAPGEQEDREGRPFYEYAPAGAMFEKLVKRMGRSRNQFRLANVVWQRPPRNWLENAPWEAEAVETWRPFLDADIEATKPKVVLAMGNTALRRFCPSFGGKGTGITAVRGSVLLSDYGWVVPTYHTSYLVQGNTELCGVWIHDVLRALTVAEKGFTRQQPDHLLYPSADEARAYFAGLGDGQWLYYDIETPKSTTLDEEESDEDESYNIVRVSACYRGARNGAITFPWEEPFIGIFKGVMAGPQPKAGFNNRVFDDPRLRMSGVRLGGRVYDLMNLWHHLQPSVRQGLQFCTSFYREDWEPWKHCASGEPERYAAEDAYNTMFVGEGIVRDLKSKGMWETVERHVVEVLRVLGEVKENGIPVDEEARAAFGAELAVKAAERIDRLQELVPEAIRRVHPKDGYRKPPAENATPPGNVVDKETTGILREVLLRRSKLVERTYDSYERCSCKKPKVGADPACSLCAGKGVVPWHGERWAWLIPFNPNSHEQVLDYLKYMKYPVPKNRKTKKPTTGVDDLKRLIKRKPKDEVLPLVIDCRRLTKVIGTYVEGWRTGPDHHVHPTPGIWGAMHRVSWRDPNASATIQDKEEEMIAAGFRRCVRSRPRHRFVEADWKGIEAVLVGHFAGDADYMRLARLGVHSYLCSHMLGEPADLSLSDAELSSLFTHIKKSHRERYDDAKHCIHGCVTGEHEVLTSRGWVRFSDYKGQAVAQWDDGKITFRRPSKVTKHEWDGPLVWLKGRALSAAMTPDHAVPVASNNENGVKRIAAGRLPRAGRVPVSGQYDGGAHVDWNVIRMVVALQADGTLYGDTAVFHLVRARKIERLRAILAETKYHYTEMPCGCHENGHRFRVRLPYEVTAWLTSDKEFSPALLKLSAGAKLIFLYEIPFWDGSSAKRGDRTVYLTTNYNSAVIVQTMAHLLRREALLRVKRKHGGGHYGKKPLYIVSFNKRTFARLECLSRNMRPYKGMVYCVTVPSGFFLVRHRNRISVTGNTNYGMGPRLMAMQYEMAEREARRLQGLYFDLFPKVRAWQLAVQRRAHEEAHLVNAYKYPMWFWDVQRWDSKRQGWALGEDAKSAVSFLPRDTAAGMLKEAILALTSEATGEPNLATETCCPDCRKGILRNCTHDSLLGHITEGRVEWLGSRFRDVMERPVPQLDGLVVGVELKVGASWHESEMEPLTLGVAVGG